jgi:hypothetical protein
MFGAAERGRAGYDQYRHDLLARKSAGLGRLAAPEGREEGSQGPACAAPGSTPAQRRAPEVREETPASPTLPAAPPGRGNRGTAQQGLALRWPLATFLAPLRILLRK